MSAHEWFRFFQWFDGLPRCQYALKEDLEKIAPSAVPESLVEPLNRACYHRFVERFDWLSTECLELMSDMKNHQASQRQIERNEILQAATAKRQVENQRKGVLFRSRRAKWEKDTEKSRLQRQSIALKDEYAQHLVAQDMLIKRRTAMLESLNKLPNVKDIRLCSSGIYRRKDSGARIWRKLAHIGETQCHGWELSDILQVGHLLPPVRNKI